MNEYLVPSGPGEAELSEKRSRFIGHVRPVDNEEEAKAFIAQMKKTYYDARHNCWCYLIHDEAERYSDDGEPQGTAGIPMLEIFKKAGVTNVVCVVTRYFGGVLLGTGGLLRAYTKSAKEALDAAGLSQVRLWATADIPCPYAMAERMKSELAGCGGVVEDIQYGAEVTIKALIPAEQTEALGERILDASLGTIHLQLSGQVHKSAPMS